MKKRVLTILLGSMLVLALCLSFSACGSSQNESSSEDQEVTEEELNEDEIEENAELEAKEEAMIEAEENAEETPVQTDTKYEDFVGSWETVTDMADDAFGGFEITFNENKTFDAVITGEEETGKCTFEGGIVTVKNEVVNAQLWFNEEGIMVVRDENEAMAMLKKSE